jgi:cytochrome oxidase Cu insertion factor (SCO1/SenC/PrrC family)
MQISKYIPRPLLLAFALILSLEILAMGFLASGRLHVLIHDVHGPKPSLIGGPFTLVNEDGVTVTNKDLEGHNSLLYFGYTNDPDLTPTELRVMSAALGLLGADAQGFKAYFVTLDPERDTPEVIKPYLRTISSELTGLTGSPEQIAAIAKAYHMFYRKIADPAKAQPYAMDYSPMIYWMGPDGKFIKPFSYTTNAKSLAADLKKVLE